jgi:hypothetical protein
MEVQRTKVNLTDTQKAFIRENYLYLSDKALAEILNVTNESAMRKIRSRMGLKRNKQSVKEFIKEVPLVIWVQRELYDKEEFNNLVKIGI